MEKPFDIDKARDVIEKILDVKGDDEDKIARIRSFLKRNSFKKVSLKDAAELVCLSPKYLSRLFKQGVGMGFSEYKLKFKLDEAKRLLLNTNYNVDQIAYKLGYNNVESFIRLFKRRGALTPTEYRLRKGKK